VAPRPIACSPWLEHLRVHLPVAEAGEDPEGVHQVRVALVRLEVWLRLGGMRVLRDDLGALRRAAGEVRDLDVLLGMGGPPELAAALRERWSAARRPLLVALRSARTAGLLRALQDLPPIDAGAARRTVRRWRRRAARRGGALDWLRAEERELRALRRRVRRVHHALEWTGRPEPGVAELSEDLGGLSDLFLLRAQVVGAGLPEVGAPSLEEVEVRIRERRARLAAGWRRSAGALRG